MNNIQINGQRRWGPPESWTGPPPPHGTEIFIKNLPEHVFEFELYATFSCAGIVYEVRLPVNWDGLNRGYAFVRFTTVHEADEAIETFDGYEIRRNRNIKVTRSVDNTRLFLSAVPVEKNADDLKRDLMNYVENVKKVYVYPTLENRSVFRGYAFVEFETHRDAAIAKRILTPDVCYGIFEKKCIAAWANPLPFLDRSLLKSLNVLFMRNIPKDIKGFHLKKAVENLTGGEEIKRVKKMNNFAFLTFKDHKSAERALYQLQNIPFLISDHETQVEWAIPREIVSSSFPTAEKGEYERLDVSRKGVERSNMECMRDLEISIPGEARFASRVNTSAQHGVNYEEFPESPDLILSTRHLAMPLANSHDNPRLFRGESDIRILPRSQKGENEYKIEPLNTKRAVLSNLTISPPSNSNSRATLQNHDLDSTSSDDFSASNPFKNKREKVGISDIFSNTSFGDSCLNLSRNIASFQNTKMCTFFHKNSNPENKYCFEDGFFSAICSTTCPHSSSSSSPSGTTSHSSESPLHSPFFSDENVIFPSTKFEEIFLKKGLRDITASKTNHFRSEFPENTPAE